MKSEIGGEIGQCNHDCDAMNQTLYTISVCRSWKEGRNTQNTAISVYDVRVRALSSPNTLIRNCRTYDHPNDTNDFGTC